MARKGNQRKDGLDQFSSNLKKGVATHRTAPLSSTDKASASDEKVGLPETPNVSHPMTSSKGFNDMDARKDGKKSKRSSRKSQKSERKTTDETVTDQAVLSHIAEEGKTSIPEVEASNISPGGFMAPESGHNLNHASGFVNLPTGLDGDVLQNVESAKAVIYKYIRLFALSVVGISVEWIERTKPTFVATTAYLQKILDQVLLKIQLGKPVVYRWMMHIGNILLLLILLWLDCTLRGIDSFLRMGSTSFFSIVWCTVLSVIAMVGFWKFVLSLAAVAVIGLFLGITLAFVLTVFAAATVLWFYGSFWTTGIIVSLGGFSFIMGHSRFALFVLSGYSIYCAWSYVGFLGLVLGLNVSFISSDALLYFLKNIVDEDRKKNESKDQAAQGQTQSSFSNTEASHRPSDETGAADVRGDRSPGVPSSSGFESEDEIFRLLNCKDYYATFGLARFQEIDASVIKKEYRRKAMLVHPDKNMGNEKAAEAFKNLQNAYEILLDSSKLKAYNDELKTEELVNYFRKFQSTSNESKRTSRYAHTAADAEDILEESRRIACKKCGFFHVWIYTKKPKSKARWCQECQDFHQAKDGDGWVEQSSRPFLFGLLQQVEAPCAYVCADGKVYDVTEWYICQGMRCQVNAHKATFHVNTSVLSSKSGGGYHSHHTKGNNNSSYSNNTEQQQPMNEEEFNEWFQNAVRSGMFDGSTNTPEKGGSSSNSNSTRRKKKGKKQW